MFPLSFQNSVSRSANVIFNNALIFTHSQSKWKTMFMVHFVKKKLLSRLIIIYYLLIIFDVFELNASVGDQNHFTEKKLLKRLFPLFLGSCLFVR